MRCDFTDDPWSVVRLTQISQDNCQVSLSCLSSTNWISLQNMTSHHPILSRGLITSCHSRKPQWRIILQRSPTEISAPFDLPPPPPTISIDRLDSHRSHFQPHFATCPHRDWFLPQHRQDLCHRTTLTCDTPHPSPPPFPSVNQQPYVFTEFWLVLYYELYVLRLSSGHLCAAAVRYVHITCCSNGFIRRCITPCVTCSHSVTFSVIPELHVNHHAGTGSEGAGVVYPTPRLQGVT